MIKHSRQWSDDVVAYASSCFFFFASAFNHLSEAHGLPVFGSVNVSFPRIMFISALGLDGKPTTYVKSEKAKESLQRALSMLKASIGTSMARDLAQATAVWNKSSTMTLTLYPFRRAKTRSGTYVSLEKDSLCMCVSAPSAFRPAVRPDTKAETGITCFVFVESTIRAMRKHNGFTV